MRSALDLREPWVNWVRIVICIDSTHRRISVALTNKTLDLIPYDGLRYVTVVILSQNRAIVSPLRNWLKPRRPLYTAIISLKLMDSRFWHGVHSPDTCWPPHYPPPPQPTSEAYEHKLKSGTGRERSTPCRCWIAQDVGIEMLGGLGTRENSSIILRRFPILVSVGSSMNRTDRISIPR